MTIVERRPRVLLIDPSLRSAAGHHLGVVNAFRRELRKLRTDCVTFASLFAASDFARDETLVPVFEKSIYYRNHWSRAEFCEGVDKFDADLDLALRRLRLRPDLILLSTADQVVIAGLAKYLKRRRLRDPLGILAWILTEPNFKKPIDDPSVGPLLEEYREAFSALRAAAADTSRIQIYCDMEELSKLYAPYVGLKVETVPIDRLEKTPRTRRVRQPSEPIHIVCVGNANVAKGYFLLPNAIANLNLMRSDLRFLIHGTVEQNDDPESWQTLQQIAALPNTTVCTGILSPERYLAWLQKADLILLPYDPHRYKTCMSGVFNEAEQLGIPTIVTNACKFPQQAIAERRSIGIDGYDPHSVAIAISKAADDVAELTRNAEEFAKKQNIQSRMEGVLSDAVYRMGEQPRGFTAMTRTWLGF